MATTTIETQIKERIQSFVQELDLLVRRGTLESLREVLDGTPARAGRRKGGRGPGRPPAAAADGSQIANHLRSNPGQTVGQIAQALGARSKALTKTIKALLADKAIRKTGQRRGTRYYPAGPGRLPGAVKKTRARRGGRRRKAKAA